jgi:hypothetical protein
MGNDISRPRPQLTNQSNTNPTTTPTTSTSSSSSSSRNDQAHTVGQYRGAVEAAFGGRTEDGRLKLDVPEHETPKYLVGRILSHYPPTPAGLQQALPEIQKYFPEARITGSKGDKIDFGSATYDGQRLGEIDVILAAGEGGKAWQWLPVGQPGVGGFPSTYETATHAPFEFDPYGFKQWDPEALKAFFDLLSRFGNGDEAAENELNQLLTRQRHSQPIRP